MRTRTLVAAVATFWTVSGFAGAGQARGMEPAVSWARALSTGLASSWMWIPLTLLIVAVVRRAPLQHARWLRAACAAAGIVAGVVIARALAVVALNRWIGWYEELPPLSEVLLTSLTVNLATSLLLIALAHALYHAERAALRERQAERLAAQLTAARLETLSARLHPHFLFNALNSISELVHRDAAAADGAIVNLAAILRESMESATAEVSLGEEIELARRYLSIESLRLGDRLSVELILAPEALTARVPRLLLQPIIENAIRHGVARRATPGRVVIVAERSGDRLVIAVRDTGPGPGRRARAGAGVGLGNARARLRELYGDQQSLELLSAPEGGTEARLAIPFCAAGAAGARGGAAESAA